MKVKVMNAQPTSQIRNLMVLLGDIGHQLRKLPHPDAATAQNLPHHLIQVCDAAHKLDERIWYVAQMLHYGYGGEPNTLDSAMIKMQDPV